MNVTIGCYIRPDDSIDDYAVTHSLEGTCWAVETRLDEQTGELIDQLHIVKVWQGQLDFTVLHAARAGEIHPPSAGTLDGILQVAGRTLQEKGRRVDTRVLGVIHAIGGVAKNLPAVTAKSIFEPTRELDPEEEAGWQLGQVTPKTPGAMGRRMVSSLLERLEVLDRRYPMARNEIARQAREAILPRLSADTELTLAQQVAYDTMIRRWERHADRVDQAAS